MGMELSVAGLTDVGLARKHNEDCYEINRDHNLYVVADGMGGHSHGEVASRIAVDSICDFIIAEGADCDGAFGARLEEAVRSAHEEVLRAIVRDASLQGMGTTVVGMQVCGKRAALAHVGDSRAYRWRDNQLGLLTQDHTWVHEQVLAGYLSEEQARHHPLKNVVTRALGSEKEVVVDLQQVDLASGDTYLICSDGLTSMLDDPEIADVLRQSSDLEEISRTLVSEANRLGGLDNVTVVLFAVS